MPQANSGNLVRFAGLLKGVGPVANWQHQQKAILCLNLLSYFLLVRLFSFSQSRDSESDHRAKGRPNYLFLRCWTFVLLGECWVISLGTGPASKLTKQGLPSRYLEWELGPHMG